jgi:hypothetical protein
LDLGVDQLEAVGFEHGAGVFFAPLCSPLADAHLTAFKGGFEPSTEGAEQPENQDDGGDKPACVLE